MKWEKKVKADIATQYATMKARRMTETKTISCLSRSLKGTSINVLEIKNCLKTVCTLLEDLAMKDSHCQIFMTDHMKVLHEDSEICQEGWMEPALKVISWV